MADQHISGEGLEYIVQGKWRGYMIYMLWGKANLSLCPKSLILRLELMMITILKSKITDYRLSSVHV